MSIQRQPELYQSTAQIFRSLGQPAAIEILLAIGGGEVCVCHLETALGLRQAYISQVLMALRQEGIVDTRRDGRYVFYRIKDKHTLELIRQAALLAGIRVDTWVFTAPTPVLPGCPCPQCTEAGACCQAEPAAAQQPNEYQEQ